MHNFPNQKLSISALAIAAVLMTFGNHATAQALSGAGVMTDYAARYDPSGVLRVPLVNVWSGVIGRNADEWLFNVQLRHEGNNLFRLQSADSANPKVECTEAEIIAAIPQLTLSLSLAQAEAIIGCFANLSNEVVDLETGMTVMAHWTASDGMANSMNESPGEPDTFPETFAMHYGRSEPAIRMIFQEGVIQSVGYLPRTTYDICSPWDFDVRFRTLTASMRYAEVASALNCAGTLVEIRVDQEGQRHHYIWPTESVLSVADSALAATAASSAVHFGLVAGDAVFKENRLSTYTLTSRDSRFAPEGCSYEILQEAYASIMIGQSIADMEGRLDCSVHTIIATETNGTHKTSYTWSTALRQAQLQTLNRRLKIVLEEGVVATKELSRF